MCKKTLNQSTHNFFLLIIIFLVGCAAAGMKQSLYKQKMESVSVGMSQEDFVKVFPNAEKRGAQEADDGVVEALEVVTGEYHTWSTGQGTRNEWTGMESHPHWFYFKNGKLVQYGRPGDWPTPKHQVNEIRIR